MVEDLVKKPICFICDEIVDVWSVGENITNAWQKHGKNHYEFTCPHCNTGAKQSFSIDIKDESKDEPQGMIFMEACLSKVKKALLDYPVE